MRSFSTACLAKDVQYKILEILALQETEKQTNAFLNLKYQLKKTQQSSDAALAAVKKLFL